MVWATTHRNLYKWKIHGNKPVMNEDHAPRAARNDVPTLRK